MAIPVVHRRQERGYERFPGAVDTYTIEAMMQDGKALQAGTSHYLGQNFSQAAGIQFADEDQVVKHAYTTSWGVSTRLIGGVIMTHADDDGLRLPPRVAPRQVVVVPLQRGADAAADAAVLEYSRELAATLRQQTFAGGQPVEVKLDDSQYGAVEKKWQWIKRGVPIMVELGPRDVEKNGVCVLLRTKSAKDKLFLGRDEFVGQVGQLLDEVQATYLEQARTNMAANLHTGITDFAGLKAHFESHDNAGFVRAPWDPALGADERLKELAVTIRCLPSDQSGAEGQCILSGNATTTEAIFARSY